MQPKTNELEIKYIAGFNTEAAHGLNWLMECSKERTYQGSYCGARFPINEVLYGVISK
jgi:hypothetical protein